ncbi:MAG TPA: tryptophan--tRNA ligase [Chloroflexia bacterium]|nr:tryptophan--tRNA ligase [Chloroflexia bacterium]
MKKRILTGDRPTGPLHLGHYVGSLANRVRLQHEYETFILIADVQALTDNYANPDKVRDNVRELALDYLGVGLDPAISTIVVQSLVPEIAELTVFYSNLVTIARLERNPTIKTELAERQMEDNVTYGFLGYPVSQAADISFVKAHLVPVGEDQLPHIELTRDIVGRFNRTYREIFPEPEALISPFSRLPGTDNQGKMSKSLNNAIFLSDDPETVRKRIMSMYTDPTRLRATDPGHVEGNPVFAYHDAFNPDTARVAEMKELYRQGGIGDVQVKKELVGAVNAFLDPIRDRRQAAAQHMDRIDEMLIAGTRAARAIARETMREVREAMHINYFPNVDV